MKGFYLAGSIIFTVLILIVGFQNFGAIVQGFGVFFTSFNGISGTMVVFGSALLGIFAGGFYFGFLHSLFSKSSEDDEEGGADF
ncbi:hypothetical protein COV82_02925 [Candidatus Peregrinibacteria bacterium CG11_big_fil_rev_8_21_14_0_20_46_8]|nr:MAG: hypothetical protein COV82_02925 [Candidatus Peregrinibacteria bacterium CG11_big_fil_rev_8_21_14_0_20_46_8]